MLQVPDTPPALVRRTMRAENLPPHPRNRGRSVDPPGDGGPLIAFSLQISNSVRRH